MSFIIKTFLAIIVIIANSCREPQNRTANSTNTPKQNNEWKFIFKQKKIFIPHSPKDSVTVGFNYYNQTGEVLLIDTIIKSCGCINALYAHKPIIPNEKGKILLSIDHGLKSGYYSKTAVVHFHGKKPVVLKVCGKID